ncbi:ROK family protein [Sphingomonas sanguinis]|nr:ROK family protein [Sphingomonas sanguinis]
MSDIFGMPVWVENDANTAALAEFYLSDLAKRCRSALVVLFGHGIGAGVIEDGRLLKGQYGNVGEICQLFPADRPRPSTVDLMRTLGEAGHTVGAVTDIPQRIDLGNETVAAWTKRAASQLAPVLSGALAWFDPGEIVLSGPLPQMIRTTSPSSSRNGGGKKISAALRSARRRSASEPPSWERRCFRSLPPLGFRAHWFERCMSNRINRRDEGAERKPRHAANYEVDGTVDPPKGPILIEIKTGISPADVYCGVGQLTVYPLVLADLVGHSKILLLPGIPGPALVTALEGCGVELHSYELKRGRRRATALFTAAFLHRCGVPKGGVRELVAKGLALP